MAAPTKVYAKRLRANITAEQEAAIRREVTLTGMTTSEVTRLALDGYFARPAKRRRAS